MAAVQFGCPFPDIFNTNADLLNNAVKYVEIDTNGNLLLTFIDDSQTNVPIPYFPDFVINGLVLTADVPPDGMNVDYTSGIYQIDAIQYSIPVGGTLVIADGHPTLNRIDTVYVDSNEVVTVIQGTPSAFPVPPSAPFDSVVVGYITVPAGADASTGGLTIDQNLFITVNLNGQIIPPGNLEGQTLRWDDTAGEWVVNSNLLAFSTGGVTSDIGTDTFLIDGTDGATNTYFSITPNLIELYQVSTRTQPRTIGHKSEISEPFAGLTFYNNELVNYRIGVAGDEYYQRYLQASAIEEADSSQNIYRTIDAITPASGIVGDYYLPATNITQYVEHDAVSTLSLTGGFSSESAQLYNANIIQSYTAVDNLVTGNYESKIFLSVNRTGANTTVAVTNPDIYLGRSTHTLYTPDTDTNNVIICSRDAMITAGVNNCAIIGGTAGKTNIKDNTVLIGGGMVKSAITVAIDYTTDSNDEYILVDSSGAVRNITLIATPEIGRIYHIKRRGANNVVITPTSGNIDGAGSYTLTSDYETVTLVYTSTEWNVY